MVIPVFWVTVKGEQGEKSFETRQIFALFRVGTRILSFPYYAYNAYKNQ